MKLCTTLLIMFSLICAVGCTRHRVTVDPIYATVDINIKIDRELDRFFEFEDELEPELPAASEATQGSTATPEPTPADAQGVSR